MILTAGENVYSVEVERVLNDHSDVRYAAVFGVPNVMLGEMVKAVVVLEPGKSVSRQALRNFCATRLADYKCPREVEFCAEVDMPMTGSGKVAKNELKKRNQERSSNPQPTHQSIPCSKARSESIRSLLEIQWQRSRLPHVTVDTSVLSKLNIIIYRSGASKEVPCIAAYLQELGARVSVISDLNNGESEDLLSKADHTIFFQSMNMLEDAEEYLPASTKLLQHFLRFSKALVSAKSAGKVWIFTQGAAVDTGNVSVKDARLAPSMHSLWGFARVLGAEYPALSPSIVDLCPSETDENAIAKIVAAELNSSLRESSESAWRARVRLCPCLVPSTLSPTKSVLMRSFE